MIPNKSNKEATLLDTGILAICGGVAVTALYPPFATIGAVMYLAGAGGIAYHFWAWSKFDRIFKNLNLCKGSAFPILKEEKQTDISTIYKFTVPPGLSIDDFERSKKAIEQFLGREIEIKPIYKAMQIEMFNVPLKKVIEYEYIHCKGKAEFPVGYDRRGRIITCDLSSGAPHMLIAGESGSGKSTVIRSIITNILLAQIIKLHLIDLKRGAEFQIFAKCKNVESFARTKSEAAQVLSNIMQEVDRRYDLFFKNDCVDITEYNKKFGGMGYEMLIIDEFADLRAEDESTFILEDIISKARACGMFVIASTQRPDARVLNGRLKANMSNVLGLKTMNQTNSRIIFDDNGLELLRGAGQGLFKRENITMIQCPYLTTERARELLRPLYENKKKPADTTENGDLYSFDFLDKLC